MSDTNPPALVGTWVWDSTVLKSGKRPPPLRSNIPKVTYTFMADGSDMPGTIAAVAMRWEGRARGFRSLAFARS